MMVKITPCQCYSWEIWNAELDKVDKGRNITRDTEGYFITIKWSIYHVDITVLNVYTLQRALKINEVQIDNGKGENRKFHNHIYSFYLFLSINWKN